MIQRPAFALSLLLAACSGDQTAPTDAAETNTPAPAAATPAPAAQAPAAIQAAALTPDGWGPLRIGMTAAEVAEAIGPDSNPEAVGGADPETCDEYHPVRAPDGMLVMVERGRLTRISLTRNAGVKTDRGLGLGIPAAAVRAAYGDAIKAEPHKYVDAPAAYLTVWSGGKSADKPGAYVDDPAARGLRYEIDATGKVAAIRAGGPSIQYVEGCA